MKNKIRMKNRETGELITIKCVDDNWVEFVWLDTKMKKRKEAKKNNVFQMFRDNCKAKYSSNSDYFWKEIIKKYSLICHN